MHRDDSGVCGAMTEKFDKADVDFSKGMAKSHCGKMFASDVGYCKHFVRTDPLYTEPGECRLVKGAIKRDMWCRKWEQK